MKENSSGIIKIKDNLICWEFKGKMLEEVNADHVEVIGEFTNTNGPMHDDWFLVFVFKDGSWKSISLYADNADQLTEFLTQKFGHDLNQHHLTNSIIWNSVVVHPKHLTGQPLFAFTMESVPKSKSLINRILNPLGREKFRKQHMVDLTEEVKSELAKVSKL